MGIGPGSKEHMSLRAINSLQEADVIVGYKTYLGFLEEFLADKEVIDSGMRKEVERCEIAVEIAKKGKKVAVVSSGDAGVYGMAGVILELVGEDEIEVEIVPGITAANAAAACLGAPLMHDFAVISLSDLLTPWDLIKKRLDCAAQGDFIITLYNPRSKGRRNQIVEAKEIIGKYRDSSTPVGIVRNAKREGEEVVLTTLGEMLEQEIDMFTMVVIGNSNTFSNSKYMITPRGYRYDTTSSRN